MSSNPESHELLIEPVPKKYPNDAEQYELVHEIGTGARSKVYRALCKPLQEEVAIKIIDLEQFSSNILEEITKEINIMSSCSHVNVVKYLTSFTSDTNLYIVTELLEGGSVFDIMRIKYPNGLEDEELISAILRQVLQALQYFHSNGHIHRDIKASNILLNKDGGVRIADFGVSACLIENGDRRKARQTFVGAPAWMAPEVMEQVHGYDYKADIWSFGITALELANGRAPYADFPPMKVMFLTFEHPPPTLDITQKKFTKLFKDMVDICLKKDPTKRPSAAQLLKHKFFAKAKPEIVKTKLLDNVMPLHERMELIKKMQAQEEQERLKKQKMASESTAIPLSKHSSLYSDSFTTTSSLPRAGHNSLLSSSVPLTNNFLSSETEGSDMDEHYATRTSRKPMSGWYFTHKTDTTTTLVQNVSETASLPSSVMSSPISAPSSPHQNEMPAIQIHTDATTTISQTPENKKVITKGRFTVQTVDDKSVKQQAPQEENEQKDVSISVNQLNVTPQQQENNTSVTAIPDQVTNTVASDAIITSGDTLVENKTSNDKSTNTTPNPSTNKKRRVFNVSDVSNLSDVVMPSTSNDVIPSSQQEEHQQVLANDPSAQAVSQQDTNSFDTLSGKRKRKSSRPFFVKDVDDLSHVPPPRTMDSVPQREKYLRKQQPTSMEKHLSQLVHQGQKQLNILNALFQSSKNNDSVQSSKGEHADVFALLSHTDKRVRQIVEENADLKKENESLKMEITRLQKLLQSNTPVETEQQKHEPSNQ